MKIHTVFREYIWLVNTIRQAGKIPFSEISNKWLDTDMSDGVGLPRTTFNRHKNAIEEMFGILIECDASDGYSYYIANPEVLREDSVQNWMLSTLSVNNVVSESLALHDRILMESAPVEGELLKDVIQAMREGHKLEIQHRRYGSEEVRQFLIAPYCIKLFKHRWYVLGKLHRPATEEKPEREWLTLFSFDRIVSLRITDEPFVMDAHFDAESFFRDSYGVLVNTDEPPQRIVLRAYDHQRFYLRDLPLHHSQKRCGEGDNWVDYEYRMRPTSDFMAQIMSYGPHVQVLEPESLVQEVLRCHKEAIERYKQ